MAHQGNSFGGGGGGAVICGRTRPTFSSGTLGDVSYRPICRKILNVNRCKSIMNVYTFLI